MLIETIDSAEGIAGGLTDNYLRVYCDGSGRKNGEIVPLRLEREYRDGLWGEMISR